MSKWNQAKKWLKEGKKVRRPKWKKDSYWIMGGDMVISFADGNNAHVHLKQLEEKDWELYKEKKKEFNLNEKRKRLFINYQNGNFCMNRLISETEKLDKEFISKLKEPIELELKHSKIGKTQAAKTVTILFEALLRNIDKSAGFKK